MQSYEIKTVHNTPHKGGQVFRVIKAEDLARHLTHAEHGETFASSWCGNFYYVPERWAKSEEVQNGN